MLGNARARPEEVLTDPRSCTRGESLFIYLKTRCEETVRRVGVCHVPVNTIEDIHAIAVVLLMILGRSHAYTEGKLGSRHVFGIVVL